MSQTNHRVAQQMAGSQKALMRKVDELIEQLASQRLQLADQPNAMESQSAQVTEQGAKLAAL